MESRTEKQYGHTTKFQVAHERNGFFIRLLPGAATYSIARVRLELLPLKMTSPAFQFYPDDFLGGVADMTQTEVGAYLLLLCHQWNRGSIPVQTERQQLIAKGPVTEHVLSKFKKCPDGQLRNERMEKIRVQQQDYRDKQRAKGVLSGQARRELRLNRSSTVVQP